MRRALAPRQLRGGVRPEASEHERRRGDAWEASRGAGLAQGQISCRTQFSWESSFPNEEDASRTPLCDHAEVQGVATST